MTAHFLLSFPRSEMNTAVCPPAGLAGFRALWPLLAIADYYQAVASNTQLSQELPNGRCPSVPQTQVVLCGTALVAVTLDYDRGVLEIVEYRFKCFCILRKHHDGILSKVVLIEIKVGIQNVIC